ncbi:MAG: chemotaxis-specific protein-glutamate methyltransferase CheB [Bdellovibrionaceae bacterium]|nr:chemotaxis-specific protein-glutamate methyltransferase CheB [Pseudobdellovibrionaceae bacterium]
MVIDDSKTIRNIIKRALSEFDDIDVVGETGMPSEAYDLIKSLKPDVLTLDINMPEMSGVELLKFLKTKHNVQVPAIIVSSMSMSEGTSVLEALENGGVDYIQKPSLDEVDSLGATLKAKLEMAYLQSKKSTLKVVKTFDKSLSGSFNSFDGLLAIGASTGGTEAIKNVLLGLPEEIPPIVIVQHIPPFFSKAFAQRLNEVCPHYDISEAVDGDILVKNKILIAPGDYQLEVENSKGNYVVKVYKGEKVSGHCPSVDVMFHSVAKLKSNRVGVILTGMGADGAKGLLAMKETGAYTISQDEESSVVYGMPKVAANIGASYEQTSLHKIPQSMCVKYNQSLKKSKVA